MAAVSEGKVNVQTLKIEGMHCASCVAAVEKSLAHVAGVAEANVNLATESARVTFDSGSADLAALRKAVQDAGYEVVVPVQKVSFKVEGMHCASCVAAVENALKEVGGVSDAAVNLAMESATVSFDGSSVTTDDLVRAVDETGYKLVVESEDEGAEIESELEKDERKIGSARSKMWTAWAITIPIVLWMIPEMVWGYTFLGPVVYNLGMVLLGAAAVIIPGWETIRSGFKSSVHLTPNMDALIAMGTIASVASGIIAVLHQFGVGPAFANFAGVGGMIMAFHLTGRYIETKAKGRASQAIKKLLTLEAKEATVERDGQEMKIAVSKLVEGDIMLVRPGEKIPTDGVVVEGESSVDESIATGESMPVDKQKDSPVIGATMNKQGFLKVRATKVGRDTFLSQVIRMVEEAQGSKVPIQVFADRITSVFVPVVIGVALLTFAAWLIFPSFFAGIAVWAAGFLPWVNPNMGPVALALFAAIATVVIACPCALGLATPTAIMVGSGMGAQNGVLIRKGAAIQILKDVQTIVMDKTGTITEGKPGVTDVIALDGADRDQVTALAAAAETGSEHPLGMAIVEYASKLEKVGIPTAAGFSAVSGRGVKATVDGKQVLVGTTALLEEEGITLAEEATTAKLRLENEAKTAMWVAVDGRPQALIAVADQVKPDSAAAIRELTSLGYEVAMLTGDNEHTANAIARQVGVSRVLANVLPDDKAAEIKRLQAEGRKVAMVGDGINDAPALTQAEVGIAIGTGTDVAIEAGDIVLVQGELSAVVKAVKLSRATFRKIMQNLFWAFFYNIIMVPLAIIGVMHPVLAEIAMAASSINVVTNSRRLQKVNIQPGA
ncbi:heavy metal translocating P-type ATPase [Salinispira pacifica]